MRGRSKKSQSKASQAQGFVSPDTFSAAMQALLQPLQRYCSLQEKLIKLCEYDSAEPSLSSAKFMSSLRLVNRELRQMVDQSKVTFHLSYPYIHQAPSGSDHRVPPAEAKEMGAAMAHYHARLVNARKLILDARYLRTKDPAILHCFLGAYLHTAGARARLAKVQECTMASLVEDDMVGLSSEDSEKKSNEASGSDNDINEDALDDSDNQPELPSSVWWQVAPHLTSLWALILVFSSLGGPLKNPKDIRLLPSSAQIQCLQIERSSREEPNDPQRGHVDDQMPATNEWLNRAASVLRHHPIRNVAAKDLQCSWMYRMQAFWKVLSKAVPGLEVLRLSDDDYAGYEVRLPPQLLLPVPLATASQPPQHAAGSSSHAGRHSRHSTPGAHAAAAARPSEAAHAGDMCGAAGARQSAAKPSAQPLFPNIRELHASGKLTLLCTLQQLDQLCAARPKLRTISGVWVHLTSKDLANQAHYVHMDQLDSLLGADGKGPSIWVALTKSDIKDERKFDHRDEEQSYLRQLAACMHKGLLQPPEPYNSSSDDEDDEDDYSSEEGGDEDSNDEGEVEDYNAEEALAHFAEMHATYNAGSEVIDSGSSRGDSDDDMSDGIGYVEESKHDYAQPAWALAGGIQLEQLPAALQRGVLRRCAVDVAGWVTTPAAQHALQQLVRLLQPLLPAKEEACLVHYICAANGSETIAAVMKKLLAACKPFATAAQDVVFDVIVHGKFKKGESNKAWDARSVRLDRDVQRTAPTARVHLMMSNCGMWFNGKESSKRPSV